MENLHKLAKSQAIKYVFENYKYSTAFLKRHLTKGLNSSSINTLKINEAINKATQSLVSHQHKDGHWYFPIETSSIVTADYLLTLSFLGITPSEDEIKKLKMSFCRHLSVDGGWALTPNEKTELNASVKSYLALRLLGDSPNDSHMKRAKEQIIKAGGAEHVSNLTRFQLSCLGLFPWSSVPIIPIEFILLPNWFPINIYEIGYWARVNLIPLMILRSVRAAPKSKIKITIDELFIDKKKIESILPRHKDQNKVLYALFKALDVILKKTEFLVPKRVKKRALDKCLEWLKIRINGENGLGGISLSIMNLVHVYEFLNYPQSDERNFAFKAFKKIVFEKKSGEIFATASISPHWDTALSAFSLIDTDLVKNYMNIEKSLDWLQKRQILEIKGDWSVKRPNLRPGGWAFQYRNDFYPDVDDTAVIIMAMDIFRKCKNVKKYDEAINRGLEWIIGMQSQNGGWGAFDADNTKTILNNIPFADHSALLDPPTVDVTARCISAICQISPQLKQSHIVRRGIDFLMKEQEKNGSWYGRWGVNYIYGTWSALLALNVSRVSPQEAAIQKSIAWLKGIQNGDGGWGESCSSYTTKIGTHINFPSTCSQTAWALMALLAVGEINTENVERGVRYLVETLGRNGSWDIENNEYTGNGHPGIIYLRYPGYGKYFPLQALAKYRTMKEGKLKFSNGF